MQTACWMVFPNTEQWLFIEPVRIQELTYQRFPLLCHQKSGSVAKGCLASLKAVFTLVNTPITLFTYF